MPRKWQNKQVSLFIEDGQYKYPGSNERVTNIKLQLQDEVLGSVSSDSHGSHLDDSRLRKYHIEIDHYVIIYKFAKNNNILFFLKHQFFWRKRCRTTTTAATAAPTTAAPTTAAPTTAGP